jgi:hypothetical protein
LKNAVLESLNKPPISLKQDYELIYNNAWKTIYDLARGTKSIDMKVLLQVFKKIGIEIEKTPWLILPKINDFNGRKEELEIIKSQLDVSRKIIINGINGIGKTWITIKLISTEIDSLKKSCWIQTNRWITIETYFFIIFIPLFKWEYIAS